MVKRKMTKEQPTIYKISSFLYILDIFSVILSLPVCEWKIIQFCLRNKLIVKQNVFYHNVSLTLANIRLMKVNLFFLKRYEDIKGVNRGRKSKKCSRAIQWPNEEEQKDKQWFNKN